MKIFQYVFNRPNLFCGIFYLNLCDNNDCGLSKRFESNETLLQRHLLDIDWFFSIHCTALFNQIRNERIIFLTFEKQILNNENS